MARVAVERPAELRVLHVGDEPDLAPVAGEYLQQQDNPLGVRTASSVAEGLDALDSAPVDCIVSDYPGVVR